MNAGNPDCNSNSRKQRVELLLAENKRVKLAEKDVRSVLKTKVFFVQKTESPDLFCSQKTEDPVCKNKMTSAVVGLQGMDRERLGGV